MPAVRGKEEVTHSSQELTWFPCYPDRILSSTHWMKMKDFQRGWYWHLLLLMTRSKPLGYLRFDDGRLWGLAGAHSKQHWDSHAGLVLACFQHCEIDGHEWIFNQKLLDVLTEQQCKHAKAVESGALGGKSKGASSRASSSSSYSKEFEKVWEENVWERVSKKTAGVAFEKATTVLMLARPGMDRSSAVTFLAGAMEEFKNSDAGYQNGMFDDYQPPYPASWLNGQRYLDDRKKWSKTIMLSGATVGAERKTTDDLIAQCFNEKCGKKYETVTRAIPGEAGIFCSDECYQEYAARSPWMTRKKKSE